MREIILAILLAGCSVISETPQPISDSKLPALIQFDGYVLDTFYKDSVYCFKILKKDTKEISKSLFCTREQKFYKDDLIRVRTQGNKLLGIWLLSKANKQKSATKRSQRPKKSKISIPKNENISFD